MKLTHIKTKYFDYYEDEKGRYQGEYKEYHDNGNLWYHIHYKDGKPNGEYKRYYDDGKLCVRTYFKDDKRHGEYKRYYKNGQLNIHSYYKNDIDKGISYLRNKKIEAILK